MLARHYQSDDARTLDSMGLGSVQIDRDRIVVVGAVGKPVGCIVWRPGGIVHELRTGGGLNRRLLANDLTNFAIADSIARQYYLTEAIFVTDTDDMARYADSLGAIEEVGKRVFTLKLR